MTFHFRQFRKREQAFIFKVLEQTAIKLFKKYVCCVFLKTYNLKNVFTTTINTISEVRVSKEVCRLEIPAKHFFGKFIERILQMHLRRLLALRYLKSLRKRKKNILLIKKFKL